MKICWLVAAAFLGPRPKNYCINHLDGKKANDRATNLEYCTLAQNNAHAARMGLTCSGKRRSIINQRSAQRGSKNPMAKVTEAEVRSIRAAAGTVTGRELAQRYGLTLAHVYGIIHRRSWKHI